MRIRKPDGSLDLRALLAAVAPFLPLLILAWFTLMILATVLVISRGGLR